ncbi:hypothetical protein [Roseibium aggregatum]|uniref:DUF4261 domain-containing protein n=1 Tax=Roseibium aggregatum TaxID=187304 RepID=A0A939J109_9HYPH|nr:hypothetical protein [Roseibium aggregatum]MBN9669853.1 hypothetical protein [Roseibium aggregatum]
MKTHPLPSVDSQILFRSYQPLNSERLFALVVEAAASLGIPVDDCKLLKTSTELDLRVLCRNFHVLVTQTVPFERSGHLGVALDTYTVKSTFPEARDTVESTTAFTQVSVQKGVLPHEAIPPEMLRLIGSEMTAFCSSEETAAAMAIVRKLTASIVEISNPDAVFWGPSVFFLKPQTFLDLAGATNSNVLYLHPLPFGETDPATGNQMIGLTGIGAPWLIGCNLEIKPCSLPMNYLVETMYAFVNFTVKSGALIADGDVFGRDENEKIQMLIHPVEGKAPDTIELKVVHKPEFGIVREAVPAIQRRYDDDCKLESERISDVDQDELDPNDPVDAAILEQLAAQRQGSEPQFLPDEIRKTVAATPAEDGRQAEVAEPQRDVRKEEEISGTSHQRLSMAELRSFARQAQVSTGTDAGKSAKTAGLFGRLFGKKPH